MKFKDAISNMFGFIWTQPIHVTLRQMRFVHVGAIGYSFYLMHLIIDRMPELDPVQAAIAYGAIAAALITATWKGLSGLLERNASDADYDASKNKGP